MTGNTYLKIERFHRAAVVQGFIILLSSTAGQAQRTILRGSVHQTSSAGTCLTSPPRQGRGLGTEHSSTALAYNIWQPVETPSKVSKSQM